MTKDAAFYFLMDFVPLAVVVGILYLWLGWVIVCQREVMKCDLYL